jgi:hypothetical protein
VLKPILVASLPIREEQNKGSKSILEPQLHKETDVIERKTFL